MNRYAHDHYAADAESGHMPHRRDVPDIGPSDPRLIPRGRRAAELFAAMWADDARLEGIQSRAEVPVSLLEQAAAAGHPDALVFLGAVRAIESRRGVPRPPLAA